MTQLVELQNALPRFEAAGIRLYAVSYDSPKALAEFARQHGITYPLLSDTGSALIRQLGILNTHLPAHHIPFYGIPWPGTFLVDEQGVVTEKFFHRNPAHRVTAESMFDSALGALLIGEETPRAEAGDDEIKVSAIWRGERSLHGATMRHIVVRFQLAEGMHIYGDPVPEGMVATQVEITGPPGLRVEAPTIPPTHPLRFEVLDAELQVWDGTIDMVFPIWADSRLVPTVGSEEDREIEIQINVRYQGCDGSTCLIPQRQQMTLTIPVVSMLTNSIFGKSSSSLTAMRDHIHMAQLILQGLVRHPISGLRYLIKLLGDLRRGPLNRASR